MNTKSDAAQANTPTPVTVERLRDEPFTITLDEWRSKGLERVSVIYTADQLLDLFEEDELSGKLLRQLLAARETIAKLESDLSRAIANHSADLSRSPAVKQATACGDTEGLVAAARVSEERLQLLLDSSTWSEAYGVGEEIRKELHSGRSARAIAALTPLTTQPITEQGKPDPVAADYRLRMTGNQLLEAVAFCDSDKETEVLISYLEPHADAETGEPREGGLYISLVDYPDEGSCFLPPYEEPAAPHPALGEGKT